MTTHQDDLDRIIREALREASAAPPVDVIGGRNRLQDQMARTKWTHRRFGPLTPVMAAVAACALILVIVLTTAHLLSNAPPANDIKPIAPTPPPTQLRPSQTQDVYALNLNGKIVWTIHGLPANTMVSSISPNALHLALTITPGETSSMATARIDGSALREVGPTHQYVYPGSVGWSSNGSQLTFAADQPTGGGPSGEIYVMAADGSNVQQVTFPTVLPEYSFASEPQWSPDGSSIVFVRRQAALGAGESLIGDIWRVSETRQEPLTTTPDVSEASPAYSPDGSQIAYERDGAIWLMGVDGRDPHELIEHGYQPRWSPDGTKIAFYTAQGGIGSRGTQRLNVWNQVTHEQWVVRDVPSTYVPPVWWGDWLLLPTASR